jgi:predicted nuclease of restriction endonuclease-like (RecB) superfamily
MLLLEQLLYEHPASLEGIIEMDETVINDRLYYLALYIFMRLMRRFVGMDNQEKLMVF